MSKRKMLSVRIEEELYDKIAKSPLGASGFTRYAIIQCLKGKTQKRKTSPQKEPDDPVIQNLQDQVSQMKEYQDHMTGEIMFLREMYQATMNRVLQIPENAGYNRDPIKDMGNTVPGAVKDQAQANIITKLGNAISIYKTNNRGFL